LFIISINIAEQKKVNSWEQISHSSKSNICGEIIVIVAVKEKVEGKSRSLPNEFSILNNWVSHIIVPFRVIWVQIKSFYWY